MPPKTPHCIRGLKMITEQRYVAGRSARSKEKGGQVVALLNTVVTTLLDPDFDDGALNHNVGELGELKCDRGEIETIILSCLAYHEALDPSRDGKHWQTCREKWLQATNRFEISDWSAGQAIAYGQHLRAELHGQPLEVIEQVIFKNFFLSDGVLKEIDPTKGVG